MASTRLPVLDKKDRPRCSGDINGNIFNIIGHAAQALKQDGKKLYAAELVVRALERHEFKTYHDALAAIQEYVTFEFGEVHEEIPQPKRPPFNIDIDIDEDDTENDDDDDDDEPFYDEVKSDEDSEEDDDEDDDGEPWL